MLVKVVGELPQYNNIVVTLVDNDHFGKELKCDKYICLRLKTIQLLFFPFIALKLRKIIRENKADLVHSHLFWPTIIARLATPKKVPLLTTIHAFVSKLVDYKKWYFRIMDRVTFRWRKSIIIAVAKGAMDEYVFFQRKQPYKSHVLYTFVDTRTFSGAPVHHEKTAGPFKLIAVGALRIQKNYSYLIRAFKLLPKEKFQLDIYGTGDQEQLLKDELSAADVSVTLKGQVSNIHEIICNYDLFVMSSGYEGFSLAVLEAMAMNMPLLLSDIPSFREQCDDTAVYFNLEDEADFANKLQELAKDEARLKDMTTRANKRALDNFTLPKHLEGLCAIYEDAMKQ